MSILFAMAAVRGGTEARGRALRNVIERLSMRQKPHDQRLRRKLAREWHRLAVCFGKAVDYLRHNFCVLSREYLYSDYMVAVLAVFFFWNRRGPAQAEGAISASGFGRPRSEVVLGPQFPALFARGSQILQTARQKWLPAIRLPS